MERTYLSKNTPIDRKRREIVAQLITPSRGMLYRFIPDETKEERILKNFCKKQVKQWLKCPIFKSKRQKNVRKSRLRAKVYSLIRRIRIENKTHGKSKICVILSRDFVIDISESSAGKIVKKLRFPRSRGALRDSHSNLENTTKLGENAQIGHMTVTKNGVVMKYFAVIERFSKHAYTNMYSKANSTNAVKFLRELIENVPYKDHSIQVDRGSEFMEDFEEACREFAIPLFALPPAKPMYNGKVERSNRIFREEFYDDLLEDTITGARRRLSKFVDKYNSYRPHPSLHGLTPLEYISRHASGDSSCLTSV